MTTDTDRLKPGDRVTVRGAGSGTLLGWQQPRAMGRVRVKLDDGREGAVGVEWVKREERA